MAVRTVPPSRYTSRFAFQHITNADGTSNSVCRRCHRIVATSHNEHSLEEVERTHTCPASPLQLVRPAH